MTKQAQTPLQQENKMRTMPLGRLLLTMALPLAISMLVQALYNVVDSIYVSRISESAVTALSLAFPVQNLLIGFATGVGVGVNSLLSKSLGEGNKERANAAAGNGIILMLLCVLLFMAFGVFGSHPYFAIQSEVEETVEGGASYIAICCIFSLGIFVEILGERLLQAAGKTVYTLYTQGIGAIINIILDPVFIFGVPAIGIPAMGISGAAVATVIGQWVAAILSVFFNLKRNTDLEFHKRYFRLHADVVMPILTVGVPSIIMMAIGSVMTFGMNKILFVFTPTATAVFGAYFKIQSFVFMPIFGLNNGMVPIISYNYGAARPQRVWKTIRLSNITAMVIMVVGFTIFQLFPSTLLELFDASETMLAIGVPALRIISVSFLLAGFCIIAGSVFQAIGNPVYSLIVSVCRQMVVLLPVAWLLSRTGRLELVWWSFPIAEVMSFTLSTIFLRRTVKSANEVMNSSAD